jgi:hypothetical protein
VHSWRLLNRYWHPSQEAIVLLTETLWKQRRGRKAAEIAEDRQEQTDICYSAPLRLRVLRVNSRAQEMAGVIFR